MISLLGLSLEFFHLSSGTSSPQMGQLMELGLLPLSQAIKA
jgi:hypothetical protein